MPTLTLSPGNTLSYEHVPPSASGKTLVCYNALSGDMAMWTACFGDQIRAAGHGWLIYNLRGQTDSTYTISQFDENQIVADALALLQDIKPARPIHVGLSIGGLFALKVHLADGADKAEGIVLINTLRKAGARLDWVNDAVVRMAETGGMDLLKDLYSPLLMNEDWQQENRSGFLGHNSYAPCNPNDPGLMLLKSGPTADWAVPYEQIDIPTLVVSGLQDRVFFNSDHVAELASRIPNVKRCNLPNAGHMIPVERPNELATEILSFVSGI